MLLFNFADERSAVDKFFTLFEEFINREKSSEDGEKPIESSRISELNKSAIASQFYPNTIKGDRLLRYFVAKPNQIDWV